MERVEQLLELVRVEPRSQGLEIGERGAGELAVRCGRGQRFEDADAGLVQRGSELTRELERRRFVPPALHGCGKLELQREEPPRALRAQPELLRLLLAPLE